MAEWIVRRHVWIVAACIAAVIGSAALIVVRGLRRDYRLEAFVASSEPAYDTYRRFVDEFTSNEIAVIAVHGDAPLSDEAKSCLREMLEQVSVLPAVERAQAIVSFPDWLLGMLGENLTDHRLVRDNLLSADGRTAALLMQMLGEGTDVPDRRTTVAALRQVAVEAAHRYPDLRVILTGPYVTLIDMYEYVDRDLLVFSVAAFGLMGVTLVLMFRRLAPMVYCLGVGAAATAIALGAAVLFDVSASLITQMLVTLTMVLSVAGCVHVAVGALEVADLPRADRGRRLLQRLGTPCCIVAATTAAGFASVCVSSISPVRSFGALMACAMAASLVMCLAGAPLVARFWGLHNLSSAQTAVTTSADAGRSLSNTLIHCGQFAMRRRSAVVLVFAVFGIIAAVMASGLRAESDFIKNFRPDSDVRMGYEFIDQHLSPVGVIEVVVRKRDGSNIVTADALNKCRLLGDEIVADFEPVRKAMTPADMVTLMQPALPSSDVEAAARVGILRTMLGESFVRSFVNSDGTALRLNLRAIEGVDVSRKLAMSDEIRSRAESVLGDAYSVDVTGLYHFYAVLMSGLFRDQYRSFGLTLAAVFIMLTLMLRSVRLAALAMAPNVLPVLFCLGAMRAAGVPINMTTAMMLSVVLGIAVDDTVHFLWRWRQEFARCGNYGEALAATNVTVGRACVFTTVVITGGFWVLVLSQFLPTAYFGGLVGFTMLGILAADLLLLPALVVMFRAFGPSAMPRAARS